MRIGYEQGWGLQAVLYSHCVPKLVLGLKQEVMNIINVNDIIINR